MLGFEKYLLSLNFNKYVFDRKQKELRLAKNYDIVSTLGNLEFTYISPDGNKVILIGLREVNKPITLISPKPKIIEFVENGYLHREFEDNIINRLLLTHPFDEIYSNMFKDEFTYIIKNEKLEIYDKNRIN